MASTLTLTGWVNTTTELLVTTTPQQTYSGAKQLVTTYLSTIGGWTPDVASDPTGLGVAANGDTPTTAALQIHDNIIASNYYFSGTVSLILNVEFLAGLSPSLTTSSVLSQMGPLIKSYIDTQLLDSPLSVADTPTLSGTVISGGAVSSSFNTTTTTAIGNNNITNVISLAISNARNMYSLDDTWAAINFYESNGVVVVEIEKFVDNTYKAIDSHNSTGYMVHVNVNTFRVVGGTFFTK